MSAKPHSHYSPIPGHEAAPRSSPRYNGVYGRDGPPSDRVVKPLHPTYQPSTPTPRGGGGALLHVDTSLSTNTRPLYSPRTNPPPPSYSDSGHAHVHPPKAAFVEVPRSPLRSPATNPASGWPTNGGPEKQQYLMSDVQWKDDEVARGFRSDEEPEGFWKRMSGMAKQSGSSLPTPTSEKATTTSRQSDWLMKQSGKRKGFKRYGWLLALLVLGGIAALVVWRCMNTTSQDATHQPAILSWANGEKFGSTTMTHVNPTVSSHPAVPTHMSLKLKKRHFGIHHNSR